jgi:hypothetical protein
MRVRGTATVKVSAKDGKECFRKRIKNELDEVVSEGESKVRYKECDKEEWWLGRK